LSLVENDTVFFSAVAHLDSGVMASFDAFPNAVEVSRVVHRSSNDVVIADHSVRWPLICLRVSRPGKGVRLAVSYALDELDLIVEFL
jgi:hypothetical protein